MRAATLLVVGFTLSASAADPRALAVRLAAADFHERDAATRQLAALGPPAIPALEEVLRAGTPEAVRRAAHLLATIRAAEDSRQAVAVVPVALNFRNTPLLTAVAEVRRVTGANVALDTAAVADPTRPVSLKTDALPPWRAVEAFRAAAGLTESFHHEPGTAAPRDNRLPIRPTATVRPADLPVVWRDGTAAARPAFDTTGVRVAVIGSAFDPSGREFAIAFDVTPTVGLNWVRTEEIRLGRVEAADGRRLEPIFRPIPSPPANSGDGLPRLKIASRIDLAAIEAPPRPDTGRTFPITFSADRAVARLKVLEGVVCGDIHRANQPLLEIDDLTAAVGRTFDGPLGSSLTVAAARPAEVVIRCSSLNPWVLRQQGIARDGEIGDVGFNGNVYSRMKFFDAGGKEMPIRLVTHSTGDGTRETRVFTFSFPRNGKEAPTPAKLVVLGTRVAHVRVPFKIENVEMK